MAKPNARAQSLKTDEEEEEKGILLKNRLRQLRKLLKTQERN
jgi:hypothetical protein